MRLVLPLLIAVLGSVCSTVEWTKLNLPSSHIPAFFYNNPKVHQACKDDYECPYQVCSAGKNISNVLDCWGYEKKCPVDKISAVNCPVDSQWVRNKFKQKEMFWKTGDFGVVEEKFSLLEPVCTPQTPDSSSLECEQNARFCRASKLAIDFKGLQFTEQDRGFRSNFLSSGKIGGFCTLHKEVIQAWDQQNKPALQSWLAVLEDYSALPNVVNKENCDVYIERPTYILQMDATVNMFHHFCDFLNLYITQHLNNSFSTDVNIISWDTSAKPFRDPFGAMWSVFTDYEVKPLSYYKGKKVCFEEVVFALPPRQRLGLFYNMPLIDGCEGTGLFRAFNEHSIHRLGIKQHGPLKNKVRITMLARESKYRNVLNENELLEALRANSDYEVKRVVYKFSPLGAPDTFKEQITSTYNSDVFVGMHGAGLTHMLFLPHWACIIELYHCEDPRCYSTLARLRGVKYMTWVKKSKLYPEDEGHHPTLGAHEKFTNYSFDVEEFLSLIREAADHVKRHREFRAAKRSKYKPSADKDEL